MGYAATKLDKIASVTDYVANGSFAALRASVQYKREPDYAVLVRLADYRNQWSGEHVYVSENAYRFLSKSSLAPGDVVVSNVGANVGTVFRVPDLDRPMTLGPNAVLVKPRSGDNDDRQYLYYALLSPEGQRLVGSILSGSAQPKFNKTDFRRLRIPYPDIAIRRGVAHILGTLDDKIELNRRMNRTLEAIARAIFKSWFIDFDPVIDNAILNGKPIPDEFAERAMIRREILVQSNSVEGVASYRHLFPDNFQDSPLGKIPKGWEIRTIKEVASVNKRSASKDYAHPEITYVDISSVNEGALSEPLRYQFAKAPSRARRLVQDGDTIWSCVRPNRKAFLYIHHPAEDLVVSTGFAVLSPSSVPPSYLYYWTTTQSFVDYLTSLAHGAAYPAVRAKTFEDAGVLVPSNEVLAAFNEAVSPVRNLISGREKESRYLEGTRDTLLPPLLSGELEPPSTEEVGEADD